MPTTERCQQDEEDPDAGHEPEHIEGHEEPAW